MTTPQPQGCGVCGAFGYGVETQSEYRPGAGVVVRTYTVEHRGGATHSFESANVPRDDARYFVRETS